MPYPKTTYIPVTVESEAELLEEARYYGWQSNPALSERANLESAEDFVFGSYRNAIVQQKSSYLSKTRQETEGEALRRQIMSESQEEADSAVGQPEE